MERATNYRSGLEAARRVLLEDARRERRDLLTAHAHKIERVELLEATARRTGRKIDQRRADQEGVEAADSLQATQRNLRCIGDALERLRLVGH